MPPFFRGCTVRTVIPSMREHRYFIEALDDEINIPRYHVGVTSPYREPNRSRPASPRVEDGLFRQRWWQVAALLTGVFAPVWFLAVAFDERVSRIAKIIHLAIGTAWLAVLVASALRHRSRMARTLASLQEADKVENQARVAGEIRVTDEPESSDASTDTRSKSLAK